MGIRIVQKIFKEGTIVLINIFAEFYMDENYEFSIYFQTYETKLAFEG